MKCEACGRSIPLSQRQVAHRIPQRKNKLLRFGEAVIHHPLNLASVCSLRCNDAVSISNNPLAQARLLVTIYENLAQEWLAKVGEP